jgi:hypothetical protein
MNKYFIIIGLQICVLIWIKIYGSGLTNNNDKECNDPLNKTLFKLRFSIWNMSHIIIFFIYCLIMKPVSFQDHFEIFMFGVVWYLMQYIINYNTDKYKKKCNHSVAYENIYKPRLDDFVYNTLGQILYLII